MGSLHQGGRTQLMATISSQAAKRQMQGATACLQVPSPYGDLAMPALGQPAGATALQQNQHVLHQQNQQEVEPDSGPQPSKPETPQSGPAWANDSPEGTLKSRLKKQVRRVMATSLMMPVLQSVQAQLADTIQKFSCLYDRVDLMMSPPAAPNATISIPMCTYAKAAATVLPK